MAFGQQSGPPSSAKQVAEITRLLEEAGYSSLREARHPFDLTQRQANGKFTQTEAAALIDRLLGSVGEPEGRPDLPETTAPPVSAAARRRADRDAEALAAMPSEALADELVRRGWVCIPPS